MSARPVSVARTASLTALAMIAFAANSILCRLALGPERIDAASFALVRLGSGAVTLSVIHAVVRAGERARGAVRIGARRALLPAAMLALYALCFSFAYRSLRAGTGALILFGSVQATMIAWAMRSGERFRAAEAVGLAAALGGLGVLVAPGLAAPDPSGAVLMGIAGIAWGVYSLRGRGSVDPIGDTARNFALAVAPGIAVAAVSLRGLHASGAGALLAVLSGAVASGLGYAIWYAALRGLTSIRAALVQLTVPILAAAGGVAFLDERITIRLVASAALILGGVGLAVAGRAR
ncbi:MAG TPA: DMT family transporter [Candidatus Eisenbacteria bacterium]